MCAEALLHHFSQLETVISATLKATIQILKVVCHKRNI